MLRALTLSLNQLGDRAIIGVIAKSVLITCIVLGATLYGGFHFGLIWMRQASDRIAGNNVIPEFILTLTVILLGLLVIFILFRAIAMAVMNFFADQVVAAVEIAHYPAKAGQAIVPGVGRSTALAMRSVIRLILVNLACLPVYIVLMFTAIGGFVALMVVNGILLGRDLMEMVAIRHMASGDINRWIGENRLSTALLGLAVTGIFMIPIVNLLAPVIGAAMATHLYHGSRA